MDSRIAKITSNYDGETSGAKKLEDNRGGKRATLKAPPPDDTIALGVNEVPQAHSPISTTNARGMAEIHITTTTEGDPGG